jgi:hypothetical protein
MVKVVMVPKMPLHCGMHFVAAVLTGTPKSAEFHCFVECKTYQIGLSFAIPSLPKVTYHVFYYPSSNCSPEQVKMLIPCSRWCWSSFLGFLSHPVFSKGTWKWAGYAVLITSIFHLLLDIIHAVNTILIHVVQFL